MKKAIFLDRDGVINEERGEYTFKKDDFKFVTDIFKALTILQNKGFVFIIITNQSGIDKGIYAHQDVDTLHTYMLNEFTKNKISILEVYYSPHHPDKGKSISRKPDSLLLEKAIARFEIDVTKSYFIGDRDRDIEAAEKVGVKGILVHSNQSLLTIIDSIN